MRIEPFSSLLGGLALFLYGTQIMSINPEAAAGDRMKQILERLTANRLLGVCVSVGITAIIQSSPAATVTVVSFVNSQLMTLKQAVWIIVGTSIGTTIVGQPIALNIGAIVPLITFVGAGLILFIKKERVQSAGGIVAGLGVFFLGMGMMSAAMVSLGESKTFVRLMTKSPNPFLGILTGAVFATTIRSSSVSVNILQALAVSGPIRLDSVVFVLFGRDIDTRITAALAFIGANRDARRATLIHLMSNIIGTALFTAVCVTTPFTAWMAASIPNNPAAQITNVHTLLNIVTILLLLPFGTQLVHIPEKLPSNRPWQSAGKERWPEELLTSEHVFGVSVTARKQLMENINQILGLVVENVEKRFLAFDDKDTKELKRVTARGKEIDLFNACLSWYISKVLVMEDSPSEADTLRQMPIIIGNMEWIDDHAVNTVGYAQTMVERGLELTSRAHMELREMGDTAMTAVHLICNTSQLTPQNLLSQASALEEDIDSKAMFLRVNQIECMGNETCHVETSVLYSRILMDYERIGDHALDITQTYIKLGNGAGTGPARPIQTHSERGKA